MSEITTEQIVEAIRSRVAKNDQKHNSTWDAATRHEIARELDVLPGDVSQEGKVPDGPLGEAVDHGLVRGHPKNDGYWQVVEDL